MKKGSTAEQRRENETMRDGSQPQGRRPAHRADDERHPRGKGYQPVRSYQIPADRHE